MITCLLFDFDGTLFDTTDANVRAYSQAFQAAHTPFDESKYRALFGLRYEEMMGQLAPQTSSETRTLIHQLKSDFYAEALDLARPNEGLLALLASSRPSYKTALVTTAKAKNIQHVLKHFKIETSLFDAIVTGEHVEHGKPNPECYSTAMKQLAVSPDECCVFEDSDVGIQAAVAAGAKVVRVRI